MISSQVAKSGKKELVLVIGGARSGKSSWALKYAEKRYTSHLFVATARATDPEMEERIRLHKESRGKNWKLVEEPIDLPGVIPKHGREYDVLLIDCLTVWLNNIMFEKGTDAVNTYESSLIESIKNRPCNLIMVSNETGFGVVPDNSIARAFRDLCGRMNQRIAEISDCVVLMVAGLPLYLKKGRGANEEDI